MRTLHQHHHDSGHVAGAHETALITPGLSRRAVLMASTFALAVSQLKRASGLAQDMGTPPPGGPKDGPPPGGPGTDEALEPFVGITTDGNVTPDLFPLHVTGVSTEPVRAAGAAFLAALTETQREAALFPIDDEEWRRWSNVDAYQRQGVSLREMTDEQRAAAFALMAASLSAEGLQTSRTIMLLNHTQGELMNSFDRFDEDLYWFTVMGEPSSTEPWGWQVDGHHLVVNYFVLGDQVVMTPTFMGSEPTVAPIGTDYAGVSVLQAEQNEALALASTLTAEQQALAIIESVKTGDDMAAGAGQDNAVLPYLGIRATELDETQRDALLRLIGRWIGKMDDGHAAVKMEEVAAHLDETWLAWIGETELDSVFYYRIHSPVILIEFDHQRPGPLGRDSDFYQGETGPSRFHIHAIVRTPNGNDYGRDLLAEHYATSPHHAATPQATPAA
jgi:hypothetical protein